MAKTIISERWKLNSIEIKKLAKSICYTGITIIAMGLLSYLEKYGLPERITFFAPFLPFIISFLEKWSQKNAYKL